MQGRIFFLTRSLHLLSSMTVWLFSHFSSLSIIIFSNIFSSTEIKVIPLLLSFIGLSLPPLGIGASIPSSKCSGICAFSTIILSIWVSTVWHNPPLHFRFSTVMLSQPRAFLFFIDFIIVSISLTVIRPLALFCLWENSYTIYQPLCLPDFWMPLLASKLSFCSFIFCKEFVFRFPWPACVDPVPISLFTCFTQQR